MSSAPEPGSTSPAVRRWLIAVLVMVIAMVAIGGITRLTGSGLSMVEWHPLMGTLPPMSDAAWERTFALYQQSPQYAQVNSWMHLSDFQRIFFWEYLHRLFGRLIGLVFFLPFVYFLIRRRLRGRMALYAGVALVLGAAQGLMGWYMVKSGLVDRPEVSHFRLAAHLLLAFAVAQWLLWLLMSTGARAADRVATPGWFRGALVALYALVVLQIVYGAFMAGTRAGWASNTFPDMNGHYLPGVFFDRGLLQSALHRQLAIHWLHRLFAWLLLPAAALLWGLAARRRMAQPVRRAAALLVGSLLLQFALGVATVMLVVPTSVAVIHQLGALLVLSAATHLSYRAQLVPRLWFDSTSARSTEPIAGETESGRA